ncbi:MAG: hypothetical protein JXJ04_07495 [Spirochaetales bacterium]|nr:hypothetical protein [Spirochaetales bacterium]
MSDYNRKIGELRRKISLRNSEIHDLKLTLGTDISQLKPDIIQSTPLFAVYEKIGELRKAIPEKKKAIKEIKTLESQGANLDQKLLDYKTALSEREKEYKLIYENIGKAAFACFKMNREKLLSYEYLFMDLLKLDVKFEQFNKVDISEEDEEKHIIRQFIDAAKSLYRNQKYKFIQIRYPGLYRQTGKALLTTDFVEDAADGALDAGMKPLIENEKIILEINQNVEKLNNEKAELNDKLLSLGVVGKPRKRVHELNEEIKQMEDSMNESFVTISNLFFTHNLFNTIEDGKIRDNAGSIEKLNLENKNDEEEIKRNETLIEIDKLKNSLQKTTNKIETMKNQIAKQEQELKDLEKEFSQLDKQKKALEKTLEPR